MNFLITTFVLAGLLLLLSFMFVIWRMARDGVTHSNSFVKTVLKVFIFILDALLGAQMAFYIMDITKMTVSDFSALLEKLDVNGIFELSYIYVTMIALLVLTVMLVFYRSNNAKIYVTSGYSLNGQKIDTRIKKKIEKIEKKARKKAAKAEKKAAKKAAKAEKKAAKRTKAIKDEITAAPEEGYKIDKKAIKDAIKEIEEEKKTEEDTVAAETAEEAAEAVEAVEKPKVIAHRRKI